MTLFVRAFSLALLVSLTAISSTFAAQLEFPFVPDSEQTTGSMCDESDPDFTEYRYGEGIPYCSRNVETDLKKDIYATYGVPSRCQRDYTIDHFIPLSLGGNNQRSNLWPEHKSIKSLRQNLEMDLYKKLSKGEITQAEAIQAIEKAKWNPPVKNPGGFKFCN